LIRFSAQVDGIQVIDRAFNRVEQHISDFRSMWPAVAGEVYRAIGKAFDTEGTSTAAGKWQALTPAYAKRKAVTFPGQPILRATTDLFESLTNPDAPDAIYLPEKDQLTIGTRDPKGRAHQRGVGRLPARPIFAFTEQDKRDIQKSIQAGLVQFVRQLGFRVEEDKAA
jgi:phage gpG-like protein